MASRKPAKAQQKSTAAHRLHAARLRELHELEKELGYTFADIGLLDRALSHASLGLTGQLSYERLEFLGDSVLNFLVAQELYRHAPEVPEGRLTDLRSQIVSRPPLSRVCARLGLVDLLLAGKGLRDQDRRSQRIHADLVEAVTGAILVDGGVNAARAFVRRHLLRNAAELIAGEATPAHDPKTQLLHFAQMHRLGQPDYEVLERSGQEHELTFRVQVSVQDEPLAKATGRTIRAAEKDAAAKALVILRDRRATNGAADGRSG
jgi:ribonuclease-3